jgi:hypothetical protein
LRAILNTNPSFAPLVLVSKWIAGHCRGGAAHTAFLFSVLVGANGAAVADFRKFMLCMSNDRHRHGPISKMIADRRYQP